MGNATIFNSNFVKTQKDQLKLKDTARILTGTDDPTFVAKDAEKGSLYLRQTPAGNGALFIKSDNGSSTNWSQSGGTSFSDAAFEIYDNVTPTKIMKWQVAGLTGTQTYTPPAAGDTLAGLGTAQTFTAEQTFNAQIRASDGTATEPSIVFTNDDDTTGTGIFRAGANSLGFSANGNQIGSYGSTGNWTFGRAAGAAVSNTHTFTSDSLTVFQLQTTNATGTVFQTFLTNSALKYRFRVDETDNLFQIQNSATTDIAKANQSGVWTLGPASATTASAGNHLINGTLSSGATSAADGGIRFLINANSYESSTLTPSRASTTPGGVLLMLQARTSDTTPVFLVEANLAGSGATTQGTAILAGTQAGAWTFGPAVTSATTGQPHIIHGALNAGGTGSGASDRLLKLIANSYDSNTWTRPRVTGITGASLLLNDSSAAFIFQANLSGDSATTPATSIGTISAAGAWTFGAAATGGGLSHTFQSNGQTNLSINSPTGNEAVFNLKVNSSILYQLYQLTSGTLEFKASGTTTTGSITSAGAWTLGATTTTAAHAVRSGNTSGSSLGVFNNTATASSTSRIVDAQYNGDADVTGGYFYSCLNNSGTIIGRIEANSNTTTVFTGSSDQRLKQDFQTFNGLGLIMSMNPVDFEWKSNPGNRSKGFKAQELYQVYPEAVSVGADDLTADGSLLNPWGIDYGKLTPVLVKALQELKQQFDDYVTAHP